LYFVLGQPRQSPLGKVLPDLIRISESIHESSNSGSC
jgi:hypothetical protein